MSSYTTESPATLRARERRRRTVVTFSVVLLAMFFAFWYALSYYRADDRSSGSGAPAATCRPYDPRAVTPAQVKVTVLNATARTGLAGQTSRSIAQRGFVVGSVGNDTSKRPTPAVAEIRHGAAGEAQAKLVLSAMPKGTTLVKDGRKGTDVDVALGSKFSALAPAPSAPVLPMCPAPTGPTTPPPA
ncbi:MAG: LytR C-terminal domain-containing protein [Phycicoccus sp.]